VPKFDPRAPLENWDIEVELVGKTWTIPASSAADWVVPIVTDMADLVIPTMFREDPAEIEDALYDRELSWIEIETAYHNAIAEVAGCRWWEAQRLMALTLDWGGVGGELLLRGFRLEERSVAETCVVTWKLITRGKEEKDLNRILHEIEKPPSGMDPDEVIDDAANMAAWNSIPSG
jgi:hypothetical protein